MANQNTRAVAANTQIDDKDREIARLRAQLQEAESGLQNLSVKVEGNTLTMTVDLSKVQPTAGTKSKSGAVLKTNKIASSSGNHTIDLPGGGQGYISVNVGAYPNTRK